MIPAAAAALLPLPLLPRPAAAAGEPSLAPSLVAAAARTAQPETPRTMAGGPRNQMANRAPPGGCEGRCANGGVPDCGANGTGRCACPAGWRGVLCEAPA
eukprot:gene16846-21389_t